MFAIAVKLAIFISKSMPPHGMCMPDSLFT
jgi:hypothetical protein